MGDIIGKGSGIIENQMEGQIKWNLFFFLGFLGSLIITHRLETSGKGHGLR